MESDEVPKRLILIYAVAFVALFVFFAMSGAVTESADNEPKKTVTVENVSESTIESTYTRGDGDYDIRLYINGERVGQIENLDSKEVEIYIDGEKTGQLDSVSDNFIYVYDKSVKGPVDVKFVVE